ncbi:MAG: hypothetical protein PHH91_12730 [Desulfuromonadaceae bacterium]|nr:hypothetical protein [Desulfuromonadaceae bacterium]
MNSIIEANLASAYEEVMWLAMRKNITPADARSWYTHVIAKKMGNKFRRFSGKISKLAVGVEDTSTLRLEHFKRIQTTLTQLVDRHLKMGKQDAEEFIRVVLDCEQVHIVTIRENYDAMMAHGDYQTANIELVEWANIPPDIQRSIWINKLRGKVMNDREYAPIGKK